MDSSKIVLAMALLGGGLVTGQYRPKEAQRDVQVIRTSYDDTGLRAELQRTLSTQADAQATAMGTLLARLDELAEPEGTGESGGKDAAGALQTSQDCPCGPDCPCQGSFAVESYPTSYGSGGGYGVTRARVVATPWRSAARTSSYGSAGSYGAAYGSGGGYGAASGVSVSSAGASRAARPWTPVRNAVRATRCVGGRCSY